MPEDSVQAPETEPLLHPSQRTGEAASSSSQIVQGTPVSPDQEGGLDPPDQQTTRTQQYDNAEAVEISNARRARKALLHQKEEQHLMALMWKNDLLYPQTFFSQYGMFGGYLGLARDIGCTMFFVWMMIFLLSVRADAKFENSIANREQLLYQTSCYPWSFLFNLTGDQYVFEFQNTMFPIMNIFFLSRIFCGEVRHVIWWVLEERKTHMERGVQVLGVSQKVYAKSWIYTLVRKRFWRSEILWFMGSCVATLIFNSNYYYFPTVGSEQDKRKEMRTMLTNNPGQGWYWDSDLPGSTRPEVSLMEQVFGDKINFNKNVHGLHLASNFFKNSLWVSNNMIVVVGNRVLFGVVVVVMEKSVVLSFFFPFYPRGKKGEKDVYGGFV